MLQEMGSSGDPPMQVKEVSSPARLERCASFAGSASTLPHSELIAAWIRNMRSADTFSRFFAVCS